MKRLHKAMMLVTVVGFVAACGGESFDPLVFVQVEPRPLALTLRPGQQTLSLWKVVPGATPGATMDLRLCAPPGSPGAVVIAGSGNDAGERIMSPSPQYPCVGAMLSTPLPEMPALIIRSTVNIDAVLEVTLLGYWTAP